MKEINGYPMHSLSGFEVGLALLLGTYTGTASIDGPRMNGIKLVVVGVTDGLAELLDAVSGTPELDWVLEFVWDTVTLAELAIIGVLELVALDVLE